MILANNPDSILEWNDFIDALDNDKKLLTQLNKFMTEQEKKNNILSTEDVTDKDSKKTKCFGDVCNADVINEIST